MDHTDGVQDELKRTPFRCELDQLQQRAFWTAFDRSYFHVPTVEQLDAVKPLEEIDLHGPEFVVPIISKTAVTDPTDSAQLTDFLAQQEAPPNDEVLFELLLAQSELLECRRRMAPLKQNLQQRVAEWVIASLETK